MSLVLQRLRDAAPLTLTVYLLHIAVAGAVASWLGGTVTARANHLTTDLFAAGRGAFLDAVGEATPDLLPPAIGAGAGLLFVWLVGQWLTMAWLSALSESGSWRAACRAGLTHLKRAWAVTLWMLIPLAIVMSIAYGGHQGTEMVLSDSDRTRHLILVAGQLPGLVVLSLWLCWYDLSRARLLSNPPSARAAVTGTLRQLIRVRTLARYFGWKLVGLSTLALTAWLFATFDAGSPMVFAMAQLLVILRLNARAAWLTQAYHSV